MPPKKASKIVTEPPPAKKLKTGGAHSDLTAVVPEELKAAADLVSVSLRNIKHPMDSAGVRAFDLQEYRTNMRAFQEYECTVTVDAIPLCAFTHQTIPPNMGASIFSI